MNAKNQWMSLRGGCNSGFSLLKVMVAMLVLSIGLIGIAGLQMAGLRSNQNAFLRSQATILASDIIDRMRVNTQGVQNGNYNSINTAGTVLLIRVVSTRGVRQQISLSMTYVSGSAFFKI